MVRRLTAGWLLIPPGLALVVWGGAQMALGRVDVARAMSWPVAEGRLVAVRAEQIESRSKYGATWVWRPTLRYSYEVGGVAFTGDQAWFGWQPRDGSMEVAEAFLRGFTEGDPVPVRHDAANPARSALFVQVDPLRGVGLLVPGAIVLFFGLMLNWMLRRHGRA